MRALIFSLVLLASVGSSADDNKPGELFKEQLAMFPALSMEEGKKASELKLGNLGKGRRYKTAITNAWNEAKHPNFAGHYLVPEGIGCGTGCAVVFVIDWNTGIVKSGPRDSAFHVELSSRLLVLEPFPAGYVTPPEFYEFADGKFTKRDLAAPK